MMRITLMLQTFLFVMTAGILFSGCETIKKVEIPYINEPSPTRYSETPQMLSTDKRKYKRMTKQQMEEESELQGNAGSLWVMEGQNSYLFSQNKQRREGDPLNVKLEGPGLKQIENKASVMQGLMKQIEEAKKQKEAPAAPLAENKPADGRAPASTAAAEKPKEDEKVDLSNAQSVPSRLVERMPDGNFRIKGSQPFMIGKKEFKVIVTGLVRPEDFADDNISSNKLLDPQFDVVTLRRNSPDETDVF